MDLAGYEKEILEAALAGHQTPAACAKYLFRTDKMAQLDAQAIADAVKRVMDSVSFNRLFQRAKEDMIGTCLESFKRTSMGNVLEMKDLAKDASDPRVRYSANKDILDRIGLAPTQRTVTYTPSDYQRVVEGLREQEKEYKEDAEVQRVQDGEDDGVVPTVNVQQKTRSILPRMPKT